MKRGELPYGGKADDPDAILGIPLTVVLQERTVQVREGCLCWGGIHRYTRRCGGGRGLGLAGRPEAGT